ncbi:hypothetical protein COLO4_17061 [Corchorus olitorius]|uniref:Uncharacterized protein n=1 Tax=Corchorus olitorius TaxID=93759 RepID=A0A1R3JED4_9ROSI|nr:hypothetical protein COLO4_17061 [Corchorus olitorius]
MRFFRRIAGFLGFVRDDGHEVKDQENNSNNNTNNQQPNNRPTYQETGLPRRGFSVPVQVAVDRPQPGPLLLPCISGDGGVQMELSSNFEHKVGYIFEEETNARIGQSDPDVVHAHSGLKWYAKRLRVDEDGDVADEFLEEVLPETLVTASAENEQKPFPKFQVKYSTKPAKVRTRVMSHDGKLQPCVEYQGRLQWV